MIKVGLGSLSNSVLYFSSDFLYFSYSAESSLLWRSRSSSAFLSSVLSQSVSMAPTISPSGDLIGAAVKKSHLPVSPRCGKNSSASYAPSIKADLRHLSPYNRSISSASMSSMITSAITGRFSGLNGTQCLPVPTTSPAEYPVSFSHALFQWVTIWYLFTTKVGIVLP